MWADAAQELASLSRCITYDRRGFFRSKPSEPLRSLDLSEHVDDAAGLLDVLSATPAVVIGRSTGGPIALALAHRYPSKVRALVLLEPAVFTLDPQAAAWAHRLRLKVVQDSAENPSAASEVVFRTALGDLAWESLPTELKELFAEASPAVLAEIRGRGLDLSAQPLNLSSEELAAIAPAALVVSAEDLPHILKRINDRLVEALPNAEQVLVTGGHLINPAHQAVLDFVRRIHAQSAN